MDPKNKKLKIPSDLSLAAFLSAGLTIVISVPYTVLCILALVYRFQCDAGLASDATADTCNNPLSSPPAGVLLMTPDTVFIFVIITLVASVLSFAAAIVIIADIDLGSNRALALTTLQQSNDLSDEICAGVHFLQAFFISLDMYRSTSVVVAENKSDPVFAITWTYICICASSLVVDITFAAFFGVDYADMVYTMENTFPGISANYLNDVLRLGSLLFMTISLKGFFAPMINITLLILLAIYANKYRSKLQTDEHSIHKVGAINAYEHQVNRGFVPEEPRRSPRSPARAPPLTTLSDYPNPGYDRSNSWQHSPAPMPFSYMEEPRRARASPAGEPQWRRDPWPPAPPLPAPDYSPPPRRLKSALKPNYM